MKNVFNALRCVLFQLFPDPIRFGWVGEWYTVFYDAQREKIIAWHQREQKRLRLEEIGEILSFRCTEPRVNTDNSYNGSIVKNDGDDGEENHW